MPPWRRLLLLALAFIATAPARAQILPDLPVAIIPGTGNDPGVTVQTRLRPAYDPLGIPAGADLIYPQIEESLGFDSAVRGADGGSSLVLRTHPSLRVANDDPDHPYGLYADLTNTRTPALPAQDSTDFSVAGGTTLALGVGSLTLGASHLSLHQDQTDLDALPTDRPIPYRVDEADLAYSNSWDRLTLTPSLSLAAWRFGTASILGVPAAQSYRDRDVIRFGLTGEYELAPHRQIILALRTADQLYTDTLAGSPTSDSHAVELLAGIDDATDGLWHYRLLAGGERRAYRFPGFRTHDAAVGEADVIMTPDGMTTLTATLARSIEDAAQEGVAGFLYTTAKLTADYEWRRNVILEASGGVQRADLLDTSGRQTIMSGTLQATWLLNRHLRVIASYELADVRSAGNDAALGGSFVRSLCLLTLRAGL